MDPIGLLAEDLDRYGATLNDELEIIQENELPINIEITPWQEFKNQVGKIAKRKRITEATKRRGYLGEMDEFDNEVYMAAMRKRGPGERNIIQYIMS